MGRIDNKTFHRSADEAFMARGDVVFSRMERFRRMPALTGVINFFGNAYLALWNHFFAHVPSYFVRHLVARVMFGVKMGRRSSLHRGIFLLAPWNIVIGDHVNIQMRSFLDGRGGLRIGSNVDVTPGGRILTEQHDIDSPGYDTIKLPVVIEDNVVIGSWALILPGVTVGEGAVVGAGSVVVKDVQPYTLVAGNPALMKRDRSRELAYRLDYRRPFH